MHMADALLSPGVGGTMWAATAAAAVWSAGMLRRERDDAKVPLMGVTGAFVFAAQMINFAIPGTGSSGHLGGGILLAILLGPHAAFLTLISVLAVQALFFADGGLLALGANVFNLGVFPCFVAYPLIYRPLAGARPTPGRIFAGSLASALVGLQLGAFGVVAETVLSGISELPFASFAVVMQSIHLAIGAVEGLVTAGVILFLWKAQPGLVAGAEDRRRRSPSSRRLLAGFAGAALMIGAVLTWFASAAPDGLEWSISRITGSEKTDFKGGRLHEVFARIQQKIAPLPDYQLRPRAEEPRSVVNSDATLSGVIGGLLTIALIGLSGWVIRKRIRR